MPSKKTQKNEEPTEAVAVNSVINRLSQQFNLLAILIVALFLFQGYTFYRVKNIESNGIVAGAGNAQESPLSQKKLISYAKDLKLNKGDFEKCLESGDKEATVAVDAKQAADLGVQGTPGFFINGQFLAGAFPFEFFKEIIDKQIDGTSSSECTSYSADLQKYCSDPQNLNFNPVAKEVDVKNMVATGAKNAKVTIVEFSDFECPFCIRAYPTVRQVLKEYKDDVKLYYKQYPLVQIHPNALKAAEASLCAADQGKFWEFHDKIFETEAQGQAQ